MMEELKGNVMMNLTSKVFENGKTIPAKYTCQGENISPPLEWTKVPKDAESLALICDDPDDSNSFSPFSHWVLYNIPVNTSNIQEQVEREGDLPEGTLQGLNDFGYVGYGGPCPPRGETHQYHWRLFALDASFEPKAGATREEFMNWALTHTIEEAELVAQYE